MQALLKANKVRYLMFNALDNGFDTPLNKEAKELLDKVDTKFFLDLLFFFFLGQFFQTFFVL